jgi:hypothetical protein
MILAKTPELQKQVAYRRLLLLLQVPKGHTRPTHTKYHGP